MRRSRCLVKNYRMRLIAYVNIFMFSFFFFSWELRKLNESKSIERDRLVFYICRFQWLSLNLREVSFMMNVARRVSKNACVCVGGKRSSRFIFRDLARVAFPDAATVVGANETHSFLLFIFILHNFFFSLSYIICINKCSPHFEPRDGRIY